MNLINIHPKYLNEIVALKICKNKKLKKQYIKKYKNYFGGAGVIERYQKLKDGSGNFYYFDVQFYGDKKLFTEGTPPGLGSHENIKVLTITGDITTIDEREFDLSEIEEMINLKELKIENTKLNKIPEQVESLKELTHLHLGANIFYGTFPNYMNTFKMLQSLDLSYNEFDGEIPDIFGELADLAILLLNNNQFTGKIPKSLVNLDNIKHLDLSYNKLECDLDTQKLFIEKKKKRDYFLNFDFNRFGILPLDYEDEKITAHDKNFEIEYKKLGLKEYKAFKNKSPLLQSYIYDPSFMEKDSMGSEYKDPRKIENYKSHLQYCITINKMQDKMVQDNFKNSYANLAHGSLMKYHVFIVPKNMILIYITPSGQEGYVRGLKKTIQEFINRNYCVSRFKDCHVYFPGMICYDHSLDYFDGFGKEHAYYWKTGLYNIGNYYVNKKEFDKKYDIATCFVERECESNKIGSTFDLNDYEQTRKFLESDFGDNELGETDSTRKVSTQLDSKEKNAKLLDSKKKVAELLNNTRKVSTLLENIIYQDGLEVKELFLVNCRSAENMESDILYTLTKTVSKLYESLFKNEKTDGGARERSRSFSSVQKKNSNNSNNYHKWVELYNYILDDIKPESTLTYTEKILIIYGEVQKFSKDTMIKNLEVFKNLFSFLIEYLIEYKSQTSDSDSESAHGDSNVDEYEYDYGYSDSSLSSEEEDLEKPDPIYSDSESSSSDEEEDYLFIASRIMEIKHFKKEKKQELLEIMYNFTSIGNPDAGSLIEE